MPSRPRKEKNQRCNETNWGKNEKHPRSEQESGELTEAGSPPAHGQLYLESDESCSSVDHRCQKGRQSAVVVTVARHDKRKYKDEADQEEDYVEGAMAVGGASVRVANRCRGRHNGGGQRNEAR